MNQLSRVIVLRHSRLLYISLLSTILYKLQNYLYDRRIISTVWISRKENSERDKLLKKTSRNSASIICKSSKFGRVLTRLKLKIISDFEAPSNLRNRSINELHEILWTLVLSEAVTPRTKKSLSNFLPKKFPVKSF